jgi:hypothetical protein
MGIGWVGNFHNLVSVSWRYGLASQAAPLIHYTILPRCYNSREKNHCQNAPERRNGIQEEAGEFGIGGLLVLGFVVHKDYAPFLAEIITHAATNTITVPQIIAA